MDVSCVCVVTRWKETSLVPRNDLSSDGHLAVLCDCLGNDRNPAPGRFAVVTCLLFPRCGCETFPCVAAAAIVRAISSLDRSTIFINTTISIGIVTIAVDDAAEVLDRVSRSAALEGSQQSLFGCRPSLAAARSWRQPEETGISGAVSRAYRSAVPTTLAIEAYASASHLTLAPIGIEVDMLLRSCTTFNEQSHLCQCICSYQETNVNMA